MANGDFTDLVSSNSVLGASIAAALAMLYKVWQILKRDRKEDALDNAGRALRDELRAELKSLKEDNHRLLSENLKMHESLAQLKAAFTVCKSSHSTICPLLQIRQEPIER